jgi:hypothetical protein
MSAVELMRIVDNHVDEALSTSQVRQSRPQGDHGDRQKWAIVAKVWLP